MAYKRTYGSTAKTRRRGTTRRSSAVGRTKRRAAVHNLSMVRAGLGLPKKMMITHKFNFVTTLNSTTGTLGVFRVSTNGLYQPTVTTTHQPMYFDQMAAIYDQYTVIGSKYTVRLTPSATNEETALIGAMINDDSTSTPTDISGIREQSSGMSRLMPPNSNNVQVITLKWSAKKTFGGSTLANVNLQGGGGYTPAEQSWFDVYAQTAGAQPVAIIADIMVSYLAVWTELKDIAQS